ncbi:MAG: hypothetical protein PHU51_04070 [Candidatus Nanoarchaeia archaeon]|nr:hypothetical protein [Candidatus Nanoarchaeia archaeon]
MADYRRTKFERRMKAYRDFQKKKEQESNEDTKEERTVSEEDKQRLIDLWNKMSNQK